MSERTYRPEDKTNPRHYRQGGQECIDAMRDHLDDWFASDLVGTHTTAYATPSDWMHIGFCVGNAFKYRWRAGEKEGQPAEQDEAKAQWYDAMALHLLDPNNPDPRDAA